MTPAVDVVLFDLGGVLVELTGVQTMLELTGITHTDELWRRWLTSPWVRRFESGGCSETEFAAGLVTDWDLPVSAADFLEAFRGWPVGPLAGAEELVRMARANVAVGCLSNTNALHWHDRFVSWPLLDLFEHRFASFEIGLLKPDAAVFEHVAARLGTPPERVLFIDDNAINVESAAAAGFRAAHAAGVEAARGHLVDARVFAPR